MAHRSNLTWQHRYHDGDNTRNSRNRTIDELQKNLEMDEAQVRIRFSSLQMLSNLVFSKYHEITTKTLNEKATKRV